jgi:hypothetical protein
MSALSDYLNAHIPVGKNKTDVVQELEGSIDRTTAYRYFAGTHSRTPPEYVLQALADVLGCSIKEVRQAAGAAPGEDEPWVPTPESNRLSYPQRDALDALIRTMVNVETISTTTTQSEQRAMPADDRAQVWEHIRQLRLTGQDDLADRLEASLETTSSASQTAKRSSTT